MSSRATKIVATLGPASSDPALLEQMIRAGVNVVRLNFSHGKAQDHIDRAHMVREVARRVGREVAIMADLQGPKIRVGKFADSKVMREPGQKFIQFPNSKIPLGSEYPTFSIKYTKGIYGILGSDVDFDKWNVDVFDDKNLKLAGLFKYKISFGGFMNSRKVFIQDYRHFKSNDVRATLSYLNGFQLMNSYINSNTASFIMETHVEHHFNGLITNKIPVIKKLKWNLLTGANAYYISDKDNYVECFIGLENIFKLFRLDFVSAYKNGSFTRSSFVLGAGGLLGAAVNNGNSSGSGKNGVTINF